MNQYKVRYNDGRELKDLGISDTVLAVKCLFNDDAIEGIADLRVGEVYWIGIYTVTRTV